MSTIFLFAEEHKKSHIIALPLHTATSRNKMRCFFLCHATFLDFYVFVGFIVFSFSSTQFGFLMLVSAPLNISFVFVSFVSCAWYFIHVG